MQKNLKMLNLFQRNTQKENNHTMFSSKINSLNHFCFEKNNKGII